MIDEWCAGDGHGRLIPLTIIPLWDRRARRRPRSGAAPTRAASRSRSPRTRSRSACRRCTTRDRYWDPFFAGVRGDRHRRQHAHRLVVEDAVTSPDAPFIVSSTLTFPNAMGSMVDYIFSGVVRTLPRPAHRVQRGPGRLGALRARARRQALGRARPTTASAPACRSRRRATSRPHLRFCIFDDETGLANRDVIGMDQITLRGRLPARRLDVPAHQGRWPRRSARRPGSTTTRPTSSPRQRHHTPSASSASASRSSRIEK